MVRSLLVAVSVLAALTAADVGGPEGTSAQDVSGVVYSYAGPSRGRRFRGDYESADALVLTYATAWPDALAEILAAIAPRLPVILLVDPDTMTGDELSEWIKENQLATVDFAVVWSDIDTPWIRDYGPLQVITDDGEPIWLDARYSESRAKDEQVPSALAKALAVPVEDADVDLDGGALIGNGRGLCASTVEYFEEAGIDLETPSVRDALLGQLGCRNMALLPALKDDPTRHADMFVQFLAPDVVAIAGFDAQRFPADAARMHEARQILTRAAAQLGTALRFVEVPTPNVGGYRTYVNGLRVRDVLVVPSYHDVPEVLEQRAYATLAAALPGVMIVPIAADEMIRLHGALHCISLAVQLPRRPPLPLPG